MSVGHYYFFVLIWCNSLNKLGLMKFDFDAHAKIYMSQLCMRVG
jgi:hypothetical protein